MTTDELLHDIKLKMGLWDFAYRALVDGKKITRDWWEKGKYFQLNDIGLITNELREPVPFYLKYTAGLWQLYET